MATGSLYLLTPWCRVLLEKLTGLQLVKKFSAFHGTPRFITALTSVRQLSLSWASPTQSIHVHTSHLLEIHPNVIHPSTPRSPRWSLSFRFAIAFTYLLIYLLTYLLTHTVVQSPSWEANWSAASQEIPCISRNPKVHYRTHTKEIRKNKSNETNLKLKSTSSAPQTNIFT